jgi:hypothetical protein
VPRKPVAAAALGCTAGAGATRPYSDRIHSNAPPASRVPCSTVPVPSVHPASDPPRLNARGTRAQRLVAGTKGATRCRCLSPAVPSGHLATAPLLPCRGGRSRASQDQGDAHGTAATRRPPALSSANLARISWRFTDGGARLSSAASPRSRRAPVTPGGLVRIPI